MIRKNTGLKYCVLKQAISLKTGDRYLKKHQYEFVFFDGLNEYYVAKEANHRKQLFNKTYPEILVSKPQLSYGWSKHITKVHKQLERVQSALDKRIEQNAHLQEQLAKTQEEVNQFRSTKFLAKELVRRIKRKLFR
ncbi:MAG: hypothetical protein U5L95_04350 [Candidatus Saccharibacteria bacterium]|nr:hypothetical protein [Candidatus Saccharibacteria bacterium]